MTAARRVLIRAGRAIDVGTWDLGLPSKTHLLKWSVHAAGRAFFAAASLVLESGAWP